MLEWPEEVTWEGTAQPERMCWCCASQGFVLPYACWAPHQAAGNSVHGDSLTGRVGAALSLWGQSGLLYSTEDRRTPADHHADSLCPDPNS